MEWKENMSKEEFEKAIQGAEDKVRTQLYNDKIKPLESEISELKPKQKSEKEIALEKKEKELLAKERQYKIADTLKEKNLPTGLSKYLNVGDEGLEDAIEELEEIFNSHELDNSYKPKNNKKKTETTVTKEQFKNMSYMERQQLYETNAELYKQLSK
ncbi:hypothetical protein [Clostridiisalibacter paucivorans]|uniref:hypothetical protein n=1 Tax=Clostridiisalibacter paucivorans TaxID=408753 RepID=UPI000685BC39|nr:hypothetical protein [Clostridiisalibacter paucivorans]